MPAADRFDQVIAALERLAQGRFARCDVCGDEIDAGRLAAAADADRCARHAAGRTPQLH